jgi:hypothetical protein
MRFNIAWAAVAAQNVTLKVGVVALSLVSIALAITTARLSFREPILIERGCMTRVLDPGSTAHSNAEIETFTREAVRQRFNSDATPIPDYIAADELVARARELKELGTRSMTQFVAVRGLKVNGNTVTIDADRLISIAQIRSAFLFPLTVTVATTARTENNPFGLQLVKVEQPKQEERK